MTPVYNVEAYLPAFIATVDAQRVPAGDLEVIAVDDGSTDGSLELLRSWAARSPAGITVLTQANAGQAAARNTGLEHATGEWVVFADPDDLLGSDLLGAAARFADQHPEVSVMSARPLLHLDPAGVDRNTHPRRWQFADRDRVADLRTEPNVFLGLTGGGGMFRLDLIRERGIRFDARIRPHFEDGHFGAVYLLALDVPRIGLLRDGVYRYRKRADGSSSLQRSLRHPGRFSDVLQLGYLDLLERGRRADGGVVPWIQHLVIYDLSWYFSEDERVTSRMEIPDELRPTFFRLLDGILARLDPDVVAAHHARYLNSPWRDVLAHGGRQQPWHSPFVVRSRLDTAMGLRRVAFRFAGPLPAVRFTDAAGRQVGPTFAKTMAHRYFGRDFLFERIVWLPETPGVVATIDDIEVPIVDAWPRAARPPRVRRLGRRLRRAARAPLRHARRIVGRWRGRVARRSRRLAYRALAATPTVRRRFANAWVLMDRIHNADDSGERLFEYLRARRPDVNAWFVVERDTPDWRRLEAGGEARLVAHGSLTWKLLLLHADWLISSHADAPIVRPPDVLPLRRRPLWRTAFLQHGVTKDDLSRWLNPKDLDLFVVSTPDEYAAVAGDGTAYRFSAKETALTGLPRFDRLRELGHALQAGDANLVLVTPTWRAWLAQPGSRRTQRRAMTDEFLDSDYVRLWLAILRSPVVAEAAAERGVRLAFMPHPNLAGVLDELEVPEHVSVIPFEGTDVPSVHARCALLVTDYSSVAFNAAYLDRPVVYFQFDRTEMERGAHVGRPGYFDYERDGFGPVVEDLAAAEAAIAAAIRSGPTPEARYQARIDRAFPSRDGRCCERVVAAIEARSVPVRVHEPAPEAT